MEIKLKKNSIDIRNKKFGKLLVIKPVCVKNETVYWACQCECGKTLTISGSSLRRSKRPTRSCGCLQKAFQKNRQGLPGKSLFTKQEAIYKSIEHALKSGAKYRGIDFQLSLNEIIERVFNNCYYCNSGPSNKIISARNDTPEPIRYNGLDRIDSSKIYTKDNVVPCCKICNIAKSTLSQNDFFEWVDNISKSLKLKGLI